MDQQTSLVIISLIGAVVSMFTAFLAYKATVAAKSAQTQSESNSVKITEVGKAVDGKLTDLLNAREDAAHAKGQLEERDAERVHLSTTPALVELAKEAPLKVEVTKLPEGEK